MEVFVFIRWFMGSAWDFFTQIPVPGLPFSFAALFVGLFLAVLSLRLLNYMFGFVSISSSLFGGFRKSGGKENKK